MIPLPPPYKRQMWDYKKANGAYIWRGISSVDYNFLFQGTFVNQRVTVFNKNVNLP